jgi:hypothetical protein
MIAIVIKGGLCNQLFMIFAGISYALDNNIDYFIYPTLIAKDYFNNFFKTIKSKVNIPIDLDKCFKYEEPNFHYDQITQNKQNILIKGYFQSYKYFDNNYDKILKIMDISLKNKLNKTISIHFRIGDYIGLQYNHNILPISYYINALEFLKTKIDIKEYKILVFCQECDNQFVFSNLKKLNYNFEKVDDTIQDYEQLLLMASCEHNIIANSTFSWWGAYLNNNKSKIVCYPSQWFGPGLSHNNTNDLCPDEWYKITL